MSRTLSLAMILNAFSQETDEVILPLITVTHEDWDPADALRAVMNGENIVSRGYTFYALPFDLVIPDDSPDKPPQATVTIDNVDRRLTALLESTVVAPTIDLEIIRASTPDVVEVGFYGMTLKQVKYNSLTVSGTMTYENIATEQYPAGTFSPSYFPGLF
jgi:hypothetical protein